VNLNLTIVIAYSYILGSIPFGLVITKLFLKEDIRNVGSGNIGATNVLRTGKKILAASTLFFDVSKGFVSVYLTSKYFSELVYLSGLICFLGHVFPVWLKFKGGKGIATYLGIILALSFKLALVFGVSWLVILYATKYSSLSSIIGSLNVFLFAFLSTSISLDFFYFTFLMIIIFTHRENIMRLKNKTEDKIKF
jgi:glycerol-3-phosphate acyltransferase PlsY|tara:strand:+ start:810 stop:1391 length:582 start_codon:yes stop_codon:yes gene_type:complete